jgi:hypothetical protein
MRRSTGDLFGEHKKCEVSRTRLKYNTRLRISQNVPLARARAWRSIARGRE